MVGALWYGWGTYGLNGWGSYDKVSCSLIWSTLSDHCMTTGFGCSTQNNYHHLQYGKAGEGLVYFIT